MGIPSTWSIFSLILLRVFCQDFETSYADYETEESLPQIPSFVGPDSYRFRTNECAKECYCPQSYPFAMYCDHRELKVIPDVPSHIRHLYIQFNNIETITAKPFTNATSLKEINLSHNNLRKVGKEAFSKLQRLTRLHLEHNNLEEVPPSLPKTLQILHLGFNKISKISSNTIQDLINITVLDLCSNRLTDESIKGKVLSGLKSLLQVSLCNNKLKTMPPDLPSSLLQLSLENNSITSVSERYFRKTPNIMSLRVSYNKIKTIPYKTFNLSQLMELNLGHNQLSQTFFIPKNLEHLYLNHNNYKGWSRLLLSVRPLQDGTPGMGEHVCSLIPVDGPRSSLSDLNKHIDNKHQGWIREAMEIRKQSPRTINRDEGAYMLSHTWSAILQGTNGQQKT